MWGEGCGWGCKKDIRACHIRDIGCRMEDCEEGGGRMGVLEMEEEGWACWKWRRKDGRAGNGEEREKGEG